GDATVSPDHRAAGRARRRRGRPRQRHARGTVANDGRARRGVTRKRAAVIAAGIVLAVPAPALAQRTWTADNGNGTFSNPLFYDEFSDPDLIRVGDDYYLTGTTMHTMPGLPILHSQDLVNWKHLGYAFERLDLGPGFRLEQGQEIYGQGI